MTRRAAGAMIGRTDAWWVGRASAGPVQRRGAQKVSGAAKKVFWDGRPRNLSSGAAPAAPCCRSRQRRPVIRAWVVTALVVPAANRFRLAPRAVGVSTPLRAVPWPTRLHFSGLVVSPLPAPCIVGLGFTAALSSPHVSSGATPLRTVSFKQKRHSMTAVRTGRERAAALCREKCSGVFFGIGSSVICAAQSTRASEMRLRIVSPAGRWTRKQTWTITTR
jgi:hypothetical protein